MFGFRINIIYLWKIVGNVYPKEKLCLVFISEEVEKTTLFFDVGETVQETIVDIEFLHSGGFGMFCANKCETSRKRKLVAGHQRTFSVEKAEVAVAGEEAENANFRPVGGFVE